MFSSPDLELVQIEKQKPFSGLIKGGYNIFFPVFSVNKSVFADLVILLAYNAQGPFAENIYPTLVFKVLADDH